MPVSKSKNTTNAPSKVSNNTSEKKTITNGAVNKSTNPIVKNKFETKSVKNNSTNNKQKIKTKIHIKDNNNINCQNINWGCYMCKKCGGKFGFSSGLLLHDKICGRITNYCYTDYDISKKLYTTPCSNISFDTPYENMPFY